MKTELFDDQIHGTLERIVYYNDLSGWSVVRVALPDSDRIITAVGQLFAVQAGEKIRMRGQWVTSQEYGRQFKVHSYITLKPSTLIGIEKYLASGMIYGVGKAMAKRLIKAFGLEVIDIIENTPARLTQVDGIGRIRARRIVEAWRRSKDIKEVMIFLQTHGVSVSYATKIFKTYGPQAVRLVQQDPYRLAMDIPGIGFKSADKIAASLGIAGESPQRAQAGVLYMLSVLSDKGHICYPVRRLIDETAAMLHVHRKILADALGILRSQNYIAIEEVLPEKMVYLKQLYLCEVEVAAMVRARLKADPVRIPLHIEKALVWFEAKHSIKLAPEQKDAIESAIKEKILVVTGGPGTGKTTLIRAIIEFLEKKGSAIQLCAPTGRAAKRMSEATSRNAKTIHRILEFNPVKMKFERNSEMPLDCNMLIIDEVSMVDLVLFFHVLKALPPKARLVLIGDADQLPSVGPGMVLKDIINSDKVKTIHLERVFRQARKSLIVLNAHRVNSGQLPYPRSKYAREDYVFIQRDNPDEVLETIGELITNKIPGKFGFDPLLDIQVLSPMHRGLLGVTSLNLHLQYLLNPGSAGIAIGPQQLRVGDKVMQMRNNYDLEVFNGDMGKIINIDHEGSQIEVDIDEHIVCYQSADLDNLALAYACSIHKAQGNEYPAVVIALHTQHYIMLRRNLLYTALTRGKSLVVVVGSIRALRLAVKREDSTQRYTLLKNRLIE